MASSMSERCAARYLFFEIFCPVHRVARGPFGPAALVHPRPTALHKNLAKGNLPLQPEESYRAAAPLSLNENGLRNPLPQALPRTFRLPRCQDPIIIDAVSLR